MTRMPHDGNTTATRWSRLRAVPGVESAGAVGSLPLILNTATISARFQMDSTRRISGCGRAR